MIPIGLLISTILIFNLILIASDYYLFRKLKSYLIKHRYNQIYSKLYLISIPVFGIWLVLISIFRWLYPVQNNFLIFSNYFLTFWYLPKLVIAISFLVIDIVARLSKPRKIACVGLPSSRRKFISSIAWSSMLVPYFALAKESLLTTLNPKIVPVEIPVDSLPKEFFNLKLVQLSDIHAGSLPTKEFFERIVFNVNLLDPDFVFITGDFVNFSSKELSLIENSLMKIKSKFGIYACPGNHEHYMNDEEFLNFVSRIRKCGVDILVNENRVLSIGGNKFQIAGVDNTSHRMNFADFERALSGLDTSLPIVLLCHDPTNWDKSIRRKLKVDLTLSGHTHGGQFALEVFNTKISPVALLYKQYAGLYSDNSQHLYVNTGIGTFGLPIRAGVRPEITLIRLTSYEKLA